MSETRLPTFYIPHGGGPCFFMEWTRGPRDLWDGMARFLRGLGDRVGARPAAVLVISAHWEAADFAVNVQAQPPLLYDYYGFPPHTYQLTYPAPGSPELANRVQALLQAAGLPVRSETVRGLDHGVFIPFKLIYPEADIPVVQLSMKYGRDPALHLRLGAALAPLRDEGVLIVGSGMSFHNFNLTAASPAESARFDAWLSAAVCERAGADRAAALIDWARAPAARAAHPEEEHLLPLMVAAGAAGEEAGRHVYHEPLGGLMISGYQFGATVGA